MAKGGKGLLMLLAPKPGEKPDEEPAQQESSAPDEGLLAALSDWENARSPEKRAAAFRRAVMFAMGNAAPPQG